MAASEPPRPIDRATLVQTVTNLSPSDLAQVVALIEGAARQISRYGTIPEHAAELIRWVESSGGPGLEAIQRALGRLSPDPLVERQKAPANNSEGGRSKLDESGRLSQLGIDKLDAREFNEALELFSEAIKLAPNVGINYYYRGLCKINLRKFTDAKKDIEIACVIDSTVVMPDILNGYRFRIINLIERYLAWSRRLRFR